MSHLPRILFVCTYRGGRSQIADAYAKRHAADVFESDAACFDPDKISPGFVSKAAGLQLSIKEKSPVSVFTLFKDRAEYDYVVCLCTDAGTEMCRLFRTNVDKIFPTAIERFHWDVPDFGECQNDPRGFDECMQEICRKIESEVLLLRDKISDAMLR